VVKKLHYEQDDTAQVGKALCDIDIEGEMAPADEALVTPQGKQAGPPEEAKNVQKAPEHMETLGESAETSKRPAPSGARNGEISALVTPAVRGLLKELDVRVGDVKGTGKHGRVTKEDVHDYVASQQPQSQALQEADVQRRPRPPSEHGVQRETPVTLTPVQASMFKVMTRSLSIPHFVYADEIDLSALNTLRQTVNAHRTSPIKLSYLPFVIKAVSLALHDFPLLNARVETTSSSSDVGNISPTLIMRSQHNIGVAMDTPQGLLVPNIKNVTSLSIAEIAENLAYLQQQAQAAKLTSSDLTGGTITVSNVGNIGGTYLSPVIVQSEVAILGMGRARDVPAFGKNGEIVRRTVGNFSWSADHRVVDGATMAKMGERVRMLVEEPGLMMTALR